MKIRARVERRERCHEAGKIRDEGNDFLKCVSFLEKHLNFKFVPKDQQDALLILPFRKGKEISKQIISLLRWNLPQSGLKYSLYDGSDSVSDVARLLKIDEDSLKLSTSPLYDVLGKRRLRG